MAAGLSIFTGLVSNINIYCSSLTVGHQAVIGVVYGGDVAEATLRDHEAVLLRLECGPEPVLVENDAIIPPGSSIVFVEWVSKAQKTDERKRFCDGDRYHQHGGL